jgi:hypothetical protein
MGLNSKIRKQIKKMPKYQIQDEAFENQNLARSDAFGRGREFQLQEENIAQSGADAVSQAKDVTSGTADLLTTVAAIDSGKRQSYRDLAIAEASDRNQKMGNLYQANQAMIDEKDKAWNQNVYAPWDAKLRDLQRRKANRDKMLSDIGSGLMGAVASFAGGPAGAALFGGGRSSGGSSSTSMDQDMYSSSTRYS